MAPRRSSCRRAKAREGLSPEIRDAYMAHRGQGIPPATALRWAKAHEDSIIRAMPRTLERGTTVWIHGDWQVTCRTSQEDDPDWSWLGDPVRARDREPGDILVSGPWDSPSSEWVHLEGIFSGVVHDVYLWHRERGASRQVARERAAEARAFNVRHWRDREAMSISVEVALRTRPEVVLGQDQMGNVDITPLSGWQESAADLRFVVGPMVAQAIREAEGTIENIKGYRPKRKARGSKAL